MTCRQRSQYLYVITNPQLLSYQNEVGKYSLSISYTDSVTDSITDFLCWLADRRFGIIVSINPDQELVRSFLPCLSPNGVMITSSRITDDYFTHSYSVQCDGGDVVYITSNSSINAGHKSSIARLKSVQEKINHTNRTYITESSDSLSGCLDSLLHLE